MSSMTDYTESTIINLLLRNTAYTPVATTYAALFTANPGGDAPSTGEVSAGWYARQSIAWNAPSNGVTSNANTITFPQVTGAGVTITHLVIYDAATGGNALFYAPLTSSKTLAIDDAISFAAGAITVTLQ